MIVVLALVTDDVDADDDDYDGVGDDVDDEYGLAPEPEGDHRQALRQLLVQPCAHCLIWVVNYFQNAFQFAARPSNSIL